MIPQSPCYKCEERYYKCHAYCDKYISFQQDMIAFKKHQQEEKREYIQMVRYEIEKSNRLSKRKHKK